METRKMTGAGAVQVQVRYGAPGQSLGEKEQRVCGEETIKDDEQRKMMISGSRRRMS
jgi:hypothetical protein